MENLKYWEVDFSNSFLCIKVKKLEMYLSPLVSANNIINLTMLKINIFLKTFNSPILLNN